MKFCFRTPLKYSEKYAIIDLTSVPDPSGCSVYVPGAHKYQEMLSPLNSTYLPAFFFIPPDRPRSVFLPGFFFPAGKIAFCFSAGVFLFRRKNRIQFFCRRFLRSVGKLFFKQLYGIFCKNQQKKFKRCGKLA